MKTKNNSKLSKLSILLVFLFFFFSIAYSQETGLQKPGNMLSYFRYETSQITEDKWPFLSIDVNAAGFIVLGPMVNLDFRIAGKTYAGAYYINHKMGLLAGTLIFGSDIDSFSPKSMGFGLGVKHYFKENEKHNAWYFGIDAGYSYNQASYHSGDFDNEKIEKVDNLVFIGSGGYRWNFGKHVYIDLGLQLGIAYALEDKLNWVYTYNATTEKYDKIERLYEDNSGDIYPYINPEISIGIAF
jgi:hypothetical protein